MIARLARIAVFGLMLVLFSLLVQRAGAAGAPGKPTAESFAPLNSSASTDWPMYGHDPQHTNYSPNENTINAGNVNQLVMRWRYRSGTGGTPASTAPIVANGLVYFGSSIPTGDNFFAIHADNGTWSWSADLHNGHTSCIPVGLGSTANVTGDKLIVGGGDGAYYALNAVTGASLWRNPA